MPNYHICIQSSMKYTNVYRILHFCHNANTIHFIHLFPKLNLIQIHSITSFYIQKIQKFKNFVLHSRQVFLPKIYNNRFTISNRAHNFRNVISDDAETCSQTFTNLRLSDQRLKKGHLLRYFEESCALQ